MYNTGLDTFYLYINGILHDSLIPISSVGNFAIANGTPALIGSPAGASNYEGGIRDFMAFNRALTQEEITYLYQTNTMPVSTYPNCTFNMPLNQIPYESGGLFFMEGKAHLFNVLATVIDGQLIGWTDAELGVTLNTTAVTYRDWHTKQNYIPSVGYAKGLNFDRTKNQRLNITGLEVFDSLDGYTFLMGVEKVADSNSQQSIFSCFADEGFTTWYDMFRRAGAANFNEYQFTSPDDGGTNRTLTSSNLVDAIDVTNKNFLSYSVSNNKYTNPYNDKPINMIRDVNCQQEFNFGFYQDNTYRLGVGFDGLTNPRFQIGARDGGNYFNGKISFFTIIKGVITKAEEKAIFNNGFYRSPFEVLEDTSKIIIDVDFQNPFFNGTDVEFVDNSGNCSIIASGTDWNTLIDVQNTID